MILKRKHKLTSYYTKVSNTFLHDPSLSLKAKGMLCLLLSLPDDWNVSVKGLQTMCSDKTFSLRNALDELKSTGYISADSIRAHNGSYRGIDYTITDKTYGLPYAENPEAGNPLAVNPPAGNSPLQINKVQNKKEKIKQKQKVFLESDKGSGAADPDDGFEF